MTEPACPDRSTLQDLLNDVLPPARQAVLAEHLEQCETCRTRLEDLALPTEFDLLDRGTGEFKARETQHAPPRDLIEKWQRETPTSHSHLFFDASVLVLARLEPPQEPGELGRLGVYRVHRVIGQGGMGIVLHATDPELRRPVAIKVMLPDLAAHSVARERFLREARSAAAVQHPNVVVIHSVESGGELPYLVMEYVEGRSLQHCLSTDGPLPASRAAVLGTEIAEGLASAHGRGLVHRDVKPANILIDNQTQRAKLTDFGLARAGDDPRLTQIGFVAGTPEYIAPEQAMGKAVDHRADIYALGATLFAALSGGPPMTGASRLGLLHGEAFGQPPPLRSVVPQAPTALADLVDRMLALDPERRPQSIVEVGQALRRLAGPRGRWKRVAAAAAALLLCGVAAAGTWQALEWRRGHAPTRQAALDIAQGGRVTTGPFVVGGNERFATLADAILAAPSGATIEIEGDGPFLSPPIHVGLKDLTIRAARGARPIVAFETEESAERGPSFITEGALTLEGLTLESEAHGNGSLREDPALYSALVVRQGPLRAVHCRFSVIPKSVCITLARSAGEIRACQFSAPESIAVVWAPESDQTLRVAQSLLLAGSAFAVDFGRSIGQRGAATVWLDHVTVRGTSTFRFLSPGGLRPPGIPLIRIDAEGNVVDSGHHLVFMNTTEPVPDQPNIPLPYVGRQVRARVQWRGRGNLYRDAMNWLALGQQNKPLTNVRNGPKTLEEWGMFWGRDEERSLMVDLVFRGTPDALNPADHSLDPTSMPKGAALAASSGADLSRVGPGPAYDDWRDSGLMVTEEPHQEGTPGVTTREGPR
jgi:hypothetical protein